MALEREAQTELGVLQRAFADESSALALERWVTTGDATEKEAALQRAPTAAARTGADWGRLVFLSYDDSAVADRMFEIVAAGFGAPAAWIPWALSHFRVSGRYAAATRHLQRRLGAEPDPRLPPRRTLTVVPPFELYFPFLDAFLDAVARAEPALLEQARASAFRSFYGPDGPAGLEYASRFPGASSLREVTTEDANGTQTCRSRQVGRVSLVLKQTLKKGIVINSRLDVTIEKDERAATSRAEASAGTPSTPNRVQPLTRALSTAWVDCVTVLPGSGEWVASGRGAIIKGDVFGAQKTLAEPSDAKAVQLTGLVGVGMDLALVSFPSRTAVLRFDGEQLNVVPLATLEGIPGSRSVLQGNDTVGYLACGNRLSLLAQRPHTVVADDALPNHFTAVAIAPRSAQIAVGRADGSIELRDPLTLDLGQRIEPDEPSAVLALHYARPKLLAVATADGRMRFLDLKSKRFEAAQRMAGPGAVIQFVPLSNTDYAAVAGARQVSVFRGTREVRAASLDSSLGAATISAAAALLSAGGEFLLLACGDAGLRVLNVGAIPVVEKPKRQPRAKVEAAAASVPSLTPEAASVLADYERLTARRDWRDAVATIGVFKDDPVKRIVVADPEAMLSATPLDREVPPGLYDVFWLPGPNDRATALFLRWRQKAKTRSAVRVEPGGTVSIDTAGIGILSEANASRLRSYPDAARELRRITEAPMGRFDVEWPDGFASGYATLTLGDGAARANWLLDPRGQVAALHLQLPMPS